MKTSITAAMLTTGIATIIDMVNSNEISVVLNVVLGVVCGMLVLKFTR